MQCACACSRRGELTRPSLINSSFVAVAGDVEQMRRHRVTRDVFSITFKRWRDAAKPDSQPLTQIFRGHLKVLMPRTFYLSLQ